MHYYQFNIADYRKDTQHLSPIEHYIYRELMDWYYLDESPIPKETQRVIRRLRLVSENNQDLKNVLDEFFDETDDGWVHGRIEEEITKYQIKADIARANGSKGGRPKKPKKTQPVNLANPEKTGSKANHKPLTNNHKPVNKKIIKKRKLPDDFLLTDILRGRAEKYWAGKNRSDLNPDDEFEKFRASHVSRGTTMQNWDAAWQTWYSNALKFNKPPYGGNHGNQQTNQPGDKPRSPADRFRAIRAAERSNGSVVGEDVRDLRPQVGGLIRDNPSGRVAYSASGNNSPDD